MEVEYNHNYSSYSKILSHLQSCSSDFVDDLSERVDLSEYAKKLYTYAEREELWLGTELIGLVAYYINAETKKAFITNVSVDVRFQKRGIATELLDRAKFNSIKRNVDVIYLEVANDEHLIEFYAKRGFLFKEKKDSNYELYMYLKPLVAIRCTVYNHEPYIRECLDGFVMQKTNFKFVAIVHDDASTDGTAAIIKEYVEKYPDIIKPIFETENQYSKKDGSLRRIMDAAIDETGAKYVALCEGDDYWTDPYKLQKQVDFMEANPEYSMCLHKVDVISYNDKDINMYDNLYEGEYDVNLIFNVRIIPTCSFLYRSTYNLKKINNIVYGDIVLFAALAQVGRIYCLGYIGAVYRRLQSGFSSNRERRLFIDLYYQYREMEKVFHNIKEGMINLQKQYLSYVIYDKNHTDTWKYRFYYMMLNKRLFFSSFFLTTLIKYMLIPFIQRYFLLKK